MVNSVTIARRRFQRRRSDPGQQQRRRRRHLRHRPGSLEDRRTDDRGPRCGRHLHRHGHEQRTDHDPGLRVERHPPAGAQRRDIRAVGRNVRSGFRTLERLRRLRRGRHASRSRWHGSTLQRRGPDEHASRHGARLPSPDTDPTNNTAVDIDTLDPCPTSSSTSSSPPTSCSAGTLATTSRCATTARRSRSDVRWSTSCRQG